MHGVIPAVVLQPGGAYRLVRTRFLLPRFHRIRHDGFLAPGRRQDLRALQVALLARYGPSALAPPARPVAVVPVPTPCPYCGSTQPRWRVYILPGPAAVVFVADWRAPPAPAS